MAIDLRSTWRPARVITNRPVANGSMWIALAATDEGPAAFHPGHVLGLGMKLDDHTLIRHAYTVSRGEPAAGRFEHLYRVVSGGRMSPLLAQLSPADTVHFHLAGNGEMVQLLRAALYRAGVAIGRVSIETYFNHHATPPDEAVDQLARQFHGE